MKYKVLHSLMVPIVLLNITVFAQQPQNPLDKKLKPFHPSAYIFNPLIGGAIAGVMGGIGGTILGAGVAGVASPLVLVKKAEPKDLGNIIKICAQGGALLGGLFGLKYGFQYTRRTNNFYKRVGARSLLDFVGEDDLESFQELLSLMSEDAVYVTDPQNRSLLHHAAACRANKIAHYLIRDKHLSVMALDKSDITPFMLALKHSPDNIAHIMYNSTPQRVRGCLFTQDKTGKTTFDYVAKDRGWKTKAAKEQGQYLNTYALINALQAGRESDAEILAVSGSIPEEVLDTTHSHYARNMSDQYKEKFGLLAVTCSEQMKARRRIDNRLGIRSKKDQNEGSKWKSVPM